MKKILLLLILFFSCQSFTIADDISDFMIEGISVGDSLLSHFTKKEIIENISYNYEETNKKFTSVDFYNLSNKYEFIQLFTNDVTMLYLLRKPNCTKFYFPITIGSEKNQNFLINELKVVNIILTDDDTSEFSPYYKLPTVRQYIKENYSILYKEDKWTILEIKK